MKLQAMRILFLSCLLVCAYALKAQFTQVQHGIELTGMTTGHTSGVSWYDFDDDGWDDLTVGQGNDAILALKNTNGVLSIYHVFENTSQVKSFQWVDYDNDGDSDFFICAANAACKLWRNDGDMNFTDATANLSLPTNTDDAMGAAWGDYDRDGWLDVYVCNYFTKNWLLHNRGDGTFENSADLLGVSNANLPTYMCSWVDYNNDCLLDLFVANDLSYPSELYENTGSGFTAVGAQTGLNLTIEAMGVTWSDYDHDLDLDVYITNVASGNKLMRNDNGVFSDVAFAAGVPVQALSWGCMWMDMDHDTYDDLHVATQAPLVNMNINFLYKQQSNHTFTNISMPADAGNSFASAKGDLNNDGYWDFCDAFVLPTRFLLWQNNGGDNHWVKLDLRSTFGNSEAIGSKIHYWHGGQAYYTHTFCGESFLGQDSRYEILSLGTSIVLDSLRIEWPSGRRDSYYNLTINTMHTLTEGETGLPFIAASKGNLCAGADAITLSVSDASGFEWSDGSVEPELVVNAPGEYWVRVVTGCNVSDSLSITIGQFPVPELTEVLEQPTCNGFDDGCLGLLLNGVEPVELFWNGVPSTTSPCSFSAGTYSFEALDENGCGVSGTVQLQEPEAIVVVSSPVIVCGNATAQAELSATGGTGTLIYTVQGADLNALQAGDYVGVATDESGCEGTVNFTVQAFPQVNFLATADSVCVGGVAGLQYFTSGGALPYIYDWQGQNPNALSAGNYTFSVTDGNGCTDAVNVEVASFPLLDAQISAFTNANNGDNGVMELSISGGEPPYAILWSTGDTDEVLDSIGQGTYSVTVTDANECVSVDSQSIIDLNVAEWKSDWLVYPNPATDYVTLLGSSDSRLIISDLYGRLLYSGRIQGGTYVHDLSAYPSGTYVLTLEYEGTFFTQRLMKL